MRKLYSLLLLTAALVCLPWSAKAASPLTVAGGTDENSYVPYNGYYGNHLNHSQILYLASDLEEMDGKEITSITFYTATTNKSWGDAKFDIRLMHTTLTALNETVNVTDATLVYSNGSLSVDANGKLVIVFSEAFTYDKTKNLLFDLQSTVGSYSDRVYFYGKNVEGASYQGNNSSSPFSLSAKNFRPKASFVYQSASSCSKPNLSLEGNDDISASFSWTKGKDETQWQFCYKSGTNEPEAEDWGETTTATSTTISDLTAGSEYTFYLRAYCEESSQSDPVSKTFTTDCEHIAIPAEGWIYSFETADGATVGEIPACWIGIAPTGVTYPTISSSYAKDGSNKLHFQGKSAAAPQYIVLPIFDVPVQNLKISFWYRRDGDYSNTNKPQVGSFSTSYPTSSSTFSSLGTPTNSVTTTYQRYELDLKDAPEGAKRVAIMFTGGTSNATGGLFIDSIKVVSTIDCSKPATPVVSNLTGTTAHVAWEANSGVTSYKYIYLTSGSDAPDADAWAAAATTNNTYIDLEGLTDGQEYDFYVMCACGTEASDPCTFTPLSCQNPSNIQYSNETYNTVTVSWTPGSNETSWNFRYKPGSKDWIEANGLTEPTYNITTGIVAGEQFVVNIIPACGGAGAMDAHTVNYTSPSLESATNITDEGASFAWTHSRGDNEKFAYLCIKSGEEPNWADTTETANENVVLHGLDVNTEYDFYVRAVYADKGMSSYQSKSFTTAAIAPKNLTLSAVGTTTATLAWEYDGAATKFEWAKGDDPDNLEWAVIEDVEKELSELTPNNSYTFYVRSKYENDVVSNSIKLTFTTNCEAIATTELPWFNGFEVYDPGSSTSKAPACWAFIGVNEGEYPYAYVSTNSSWKKTGSKSLYIVASGSKDGYVIFPEFESKLNTLQISFSHKEESDSKSAVLTLGYMTNIANAESFVVIKEFTRSTSWQTESEISLASLSDELTARLAFKLGKATDNWFTGIDDITVSVLPSCPKPTGLTASDVLYNSATLSWTAGGTETAWNLRYKTSTDEDWTTIVVNATSMNLTDLTTGATYTAQVQAACEGDWSTAVEFIPQCKTPSGLKQDSKTTNTATISWTVNSGETEWNVQYSANGGSSWTTVENVTANPYTLEGLDPGKTYKVKVAATCNGTYTSAIDVETECKTLTPLGWTEGFEGFSTGSYATTGLLCWDELNAVHTSSYSYPQVYVAEESTYVKTGSKSLFFRSSSSKNVYAILPEFSGSFTGLQMTFWHKEENVSASGATTLGYFTNITNEETFVTLKTCDRKTKEWQEEVVSLATVPTGARLAFRCGTANDNYYTGIDDISIAEIPSCVEPSAVKGQGLSSTTASISWTENNSKTQWQLQYSSDNGENWSNVMDGDNVATITANPYTLNGLTADNTYIARVRTICAEGDTSVWSTASASFQTDCNAVDMPFEESFGSSLPDCWRLSKSAGYDWAPNSTYKVSATYSMQYYAYTALTDSSDMVTPSINLTEDALLSFQLRNYYYGSEASGEVYIVVGLDTTKLLDLPVTTSSFALQNIDLSDYTGKTAKFIFRGHGKNSGAIINIDDVAVKAKPCDAPTALNVVASSSDAVITWTDEAASKWNLRWHEVTEPANDVWTVVENLTVKTLTLTKADDNLAVDKTYEVQVQAVCTDTKSSAWSTAKTFELVCEAPTALAVTARTNNSATLSWTSTESAWKLQYKAETDENWTEESVAEKPFVLGGLSAGTTYQAKIQSACGSDFSNVVEFTTWCGVQEASELPINITSFSAVPECWEATFKGGYSGIAGSKICFYGTEEQMIVLPAYNINLNELSVTFTFTTSNATPEFGYIDAPNGDFHAFATALTSGVELDLKDEAEAVKYIAVRYPGGSSNYANVQISAINIRVTPTCLKPTEVQADADITSAEISWTKGGDETAWKLQYKLASVSSWSDAIDVTENPYELTGLTEGSVYKVRVQANCGEALSDWSDEAQFTTDCGTIATLPYEADFTKALSNCWTVFADDETYYKPSVNTYSSTLQMNGGKTGASENMVALPAISASLTNKVIAFEYKGGATGGTLEVGYLTDKTNKATFTSLNPAATFEPVESYTAVSVAVDGLENKYITLRHAGGSSHGDLSIHGLSVKEKPEIPSTISNAEAEKKAIKLIENNQLVIIHNGVRYNALGEKIQ